MSSAATTAAASNGSSSATLCSAQVSYKKQPGVLTLTRRALTWGVGGMTPQIEVNSGRMTALFASKEGAAKVQLRVAASALPSAATPEEEVFNFHFTAGASAVSDREHFKKELSAIIAANRDRDAAPPPPAVPLPSATTAAGDKGKGKERVGTPGANPNASNAVEIRLRKLVLQAHPQLMSLHRDLVMSRQITEAEFWEGREDLIEAAKAAEAQLKGKSGEMVDPRPETSESGEVTVKITPALIADIFAEYPAVLKAYTDNVPDPLDEQEFWTRYFQSKLFNRNRTANRAAVSTIKDDKIFDLYLGEEDDDIEPKNLKEHQIYRLLDLAATEEDQHEVTNQRDVTMRPGRERAALPLMRRFNEHSERLLNQSLGASVDRNRISFDPGNAGDRNYYADILLDDLIDQEASDRIQLDMQDRTKVAQGAESSTKSSLMDEIEAGSVIHTTKDLFEIWEPRLGEVDVDRMAVDDAMTDMMRNIKQKLERGSRESDSTSTGGIARATLHECQTVQSASKEFLRQFWSAVLPPKTNDISASALSTPAQKAAKAERMKSYLDNMQERIQTILRVQRSPNEQVRVEAALQPIREALSTAIQFYTSRVG